MVYFNYGEAKSYNGDLVAQSHCGGFFFLIKKAFRTFFRFEITIKKFSLLEIRNTFRNILVWLKIRANSRNTRKYVIETIFRVKLIV